MSCDFGNFVIESDQYNYLGTYLHITIESENIRSTVNKVVLTNGIGKTS